MIAGVPGIGKTILAEMLLLDYAAQGYEPIVISADIGEADRVLDPKRPQIFYYDDFLGQTSLAEKFQKNEDDRLVRFIERVLDDDKKRFVLTTREYILQQAQMNYEKIHRDRALKLGKYMLELSTYTRLERAHIFYNHLFFSQIPSGWRQALLEKKAYLKFIDHANYNPRLIEGVVELAAGRARSSSEFLEFMFKTFEDPRELWAHPFDRQLSELAKAILIVLATLPSEAELSDVREVADAYVGMRSTEREFRDALQILDDTFVNTDRADGIQTLRFHNPSIRDFLLNRLDETHDDVARLVSSARYYSQCRLLWSYAHATKQLLPGSTRVLEHAGIREVLYRQRELFLASLRRTYPLSDCAHVYRHGGVSRRVSGMSVSWEVRLRFYVETRQMFGVVDDEIWLSETLGAAFALWKSEQGTAEDALDLLMQLEKSGVWTAAERVSLLEAGKELLFGEIYQSDDIRRLMSFRDSFPGFWSPSDSESLRDVFDWWHKDELNNIRREASDYADADRALEEIEALAEALSVHVDEDRIESVRHAAYERFSSRDWSLSERPVRGSDMSMDEQSDTQIDAMFSALRDEQSN